MQRGCRRFQHDRATDSDLTRGGDHDGSLPDDCGHDDHRSTNHHDYDDLNHDDDHERYDHRCTDHNGSRITVRLCGLP